MAMKRLSPAQQALLMALGQGHILKAHRDVEGGKRVLLHPLADHAQAQTVHRATLDALVRRGLLESNKKFPAATFYLTEAGRQAAAALLGAEVTAVGENFRPG